MFQLQAQRAALQDIDDPFWGLATCVDRAGQHGARRYEFEWEREWRVVGPHGLRFDIADVAFLFFPESDHLAARGFFASWHAEHQMPTYTCPFIDPLWSSERIEATLRTART